MTYVRGRTLLLAGAFALTAGAFAATSASAANFGGPAGGARADACARMNERLEHMNRSLSADQIRDIVAGRIAGTGIDTLKVGKVMTKGDIVTVEIVTKDGSLVTTRDISMKTGLAATAGDRCERAVERLEKARGEPGMRPRMLRERRGRLDMNGPGRPGLGQNLLGLGLLGAEPGRDLNLTAAQVKTLSEAALIRAGNPRLKVGAVKEKDADTFSVDIVTQDNSLVLQREVDRHTGRVHRRS